MSKIREAWIHTEGDVYYFEEKYIDKFMGFLKENPKDIISIQITETMTKEEFERMHNDLGQSS